MAHHPTPPAPVSKTVQRLLAQIHAEAEAATLTALSAKDGIVILHPAENPAWIATDIGLSMRSNNGAEIHCHIYHERHGERQIPFWLVRERRPDSNGRFWERYLGRHVVDDSGTLVCVEGGAA